MDLYIYGFINIWIYLYRYKSIYIHGFIYIWIYKYMDLFI